MPIASPPVEIAKPHASRGGPTDPSHDERLRRGILETQISRRVAVGTTILFLVMVYIIPVGQAALEKLRGDELSFVSLFRTLPTAERLRQFEDDLEQASYAKDAVQPRMQATLTRFGRVGNKRAVVGRDGWLYYRPGVTHVAGPGFLDPDAISARERAALDSAEPPVHADPRPAVLAFRQALAKRGITLVLFPVPDKVALQPLELHGRARGPVMPVPRNLDWNRFADEMRAAGVVVFDISPSELKAGERPRYLKGDTHWTPEWMEQIAGRLADTVIGVARLSPDRHPESFVSVPKDVEALGDVALMLKLPENQSVFTPQRVTVHAVEDSAGTAWEPDPKGEVLLLGDSFTNIFSMGAMGWGEAAGLAAHLARALARPLDVIAQNDSGAFATRQALARELSADHQRLAGKKVVIWEFASRELSVGDWKPVDWEAAFAAPQAER